MMKLKAFLSVAAFGLLVAGCGGGGTNTALDPNTGRSTSDYSLANQGNKILTCDAFVDKQSYANGDTINLFIRGYNAGDYLKADCGVKIVRSNDGAVLWNSFDEGLYATLIPQDSTTWSKIVSTVAGPGWASTANYKVEAELRIISGENELGNAATTSGNSQHLGFPWGTNSNFNISN